jgi:ribosomal protein S18 acetylase RimI-like enzyme
LPSIVTYQASHFDGIRLLWRQAFRSNAPNDAAELSFPANLSMQPDLFLVAIDRDIVVGSAVASIIAGYDGHRGWLYAVAVLQSHQRQGIATALVREAENRLIGMGCKKINLYVRQSDIPVIKFYKSLGYEVEELVSMGKRAQ